MWILEERQYLQFTLFYYIAFFFAVCSVQAYYEGYEQIGVPVLDKLPVIDKIRSKKKI